MKSEIELGDVVKDVYTGFIGVAVARTVFINGCIQISVIPKCSKDNKPADEQGIDEESLVVVKKGKRKVVTKEPEEELNGGAYTKPMARRNY